MKSTFGFRNFYFWTNDGNVYSSRVTKCFYTLEMCSEKLSISKKYGLCNIIKEMMNS